MKFLIAYIFHLHLETYTNIYLKIETNNKAVSSLQNFVIKRKRKGFNDNDAWRLSQFLIVYNF